MTFTPAGGGEPITRKVYEFPGGGVAMGMYNLDDSIRGFARSSFNFSLQHDMTAVSATCSRRSTTTSSPPNSKNAI